MYQITGSTYEAREALKKAGYTFEPLGKTWVGQSREAFDALIAKWRKPGYGVAFAKLADKLHIAETCCETCEI